MKVMVLVKATPSSEAGELPSQKLLSDMGSFNEELIQAGIMRDGEGLKPSSQGVRVRFAGSSRSVTDGPFTETKELVAGYWLWEVNSMQEAIEWVKRCPNPMLEDSDIEIRPLYEMSDFAELDPSGEFAEQEAGFKQALAAQSYKLQPYLFYSGRCEEALEFYKTAIGAKVGMIMRFNESPTALPAGILQPGFENKIMHSAFTVGSLTILASDGCDDKTTFSGFRLALSVSTVEEAERLFDALAVGGKVDMPLEQTFWAVTYGQVTDKFNVGWMVMVPAPGVT